jgi:hypothetical protein
LLTGHDPITPGRLASKRADWSKVKALGGQVEVFQDTLHDEDALVERLKPCESQPDSPAMSSNLLADGASCPFQSTSSARCASGRRSLKA